MTANSGAQPEPTVKPLVAEPGPVNPLWLWGLGGFLLIFWASLASQLRYDWDAFEQYNYGWAVPFLCLWLAIRALDRVALVPPPARRTRVKAVAPADRRAALQMFFVFWGGAYLLTRLMLEAHPSWRMACWTLALEGVAVSWFCTHLLGGQRLWRAIGFSVVFFLISVPWPTVVESPVIGGLTRFNTQAAVEVVNLLGIAAIRKGNTILLHSGTVGVDEACSGIRSFQAAAMIALFLGEYYLLRTSRRVALVLFGLGFSMAFNTIRSSLLVWIAFKSGIDAIGKWHDMAGIYILVACFICLWGVAVLFRRREKMDAALRHKVDLLDFAATTDSPGAWGQMRQRWELPPAWFIVGLCGWLVFVEGGLQGIQLYHRLDQTPGVTWQVRSPSEKADFKTAELKPEVRRSLGCDQVVQNFWSEGDGNRWQMLFLEWKPGRMAAILANAHTPQSCLPGAGKEIGRSGDLKLVKVGNLELPVKFYSASDNGTPLDVAYCLWNDRGDNTTFESVKFYLQSMMASFWKGQHGRRSLELAVWGIANPEHAEAALIAQMQELIVPGAGPASPTAKQSPTSTNSSAQE